MDDVGSPRSEDDNTESELGNSDAEGVWSPDIEQSFQEALQIYPPCGRRKIILSDEGKMYGRNELIARYIKVRTGKTRTRKQVSSHIQVLARKKSREIQSKLKIVSATMFPNKNAGAGLPLPTLGLAGANAAYGPATFWPNSGSHGPDIKPCLNSAGFPSSVLSGTSLMQNNGNNITYDGRSIASHKLRLLDFQAFVESHRDPDSKHVFVNIGPSTGVEPALETIDFRQIYDKFPEKRGGLKELYEKGPTNAFFLVKFWADINCSDIDSSAFYGVSSTFESAESMTIQCSTRVCSFGKQVVEKVEKDVARFEGGRYMYRISRSQMCEYMINFVLKLKDLPQKDMMNSVLENFTILQVITNDDTKEILICLAFVFEVSTSDHGTQHHVYRLVKD
ncbi:transcriptional enhancer factor TEF-1-like isoform X2 [Paramacrobiotus metropolitanus]|uniref:transcriptional enhancer factor TEF-1-like isoform X2 n=1 Tax=Paramacrobiotus metropolitanus TaxID=2943436 RepID=UPI00244601C1|nr:transcriptional enhancer factor TEF-1-like isoform X2 [Paramacrobiotus metropolitanus]